VSFTLWYPITVGIAIPPSPGSTAVPSPMRPPYTNAPHAYIGNFPTRAPTPRSFAGTTIRESIAAPNVERPCQDRHTEHWGRSADVKKTAVGEFELVGSGHVDNEATPPPGPHGKPAVAGASTISSWSWKTVLLTAAFACPT
jgi:hypothetical protein